MTDIDKLATSLSDDDLRSARRRLVRIARVSLLVWVACFVAGVWVDLRWLATLVIPFGVWAVTTYGGNRLLAEMARRKGPLGAP